MLVNGVEPLDELGLLKLLQGLVGDVGGVRLEVLYGNVALGVAPLGSGLLKLAQGIVESLGVDIGTHKADEHVGELIHALLVVGVEQGVYGCLVARYRGVGHSLLKVVGTLKIGLCQDGRILNCHSKYRLSAIRARKDGMETSLSLGPNRAVCYG